MRDSDPRPMPVEIQRAYRDPVRLGELLLTDAYSDVDRMKVRDALLSYLLEKYGDVWVASGSREARISTRAKSFRANPIRGIEAILDVPDYGGREETLPLLARAMQPMWAQWWNAFRWTHWGSICLWTRVVNHVLSARQLAWLSAQHARSAIDRTRAADRGVALNSIEATEAWARVPSEENRKKLLRASDAASISAFAARDTRFQTNDAVAGYINAAFAAARAPSAVVGINGSIYDEAASYAAYFAVLSDVDVAYAEGIGADDPGGLSAYARLVSLTRRLITPTLVTSAA